MSVPLLPGRRGRTASETSGLVSDMRMLVQAGEQRPEAADDEASLERAVSYRIATLLMVLLISLVFITSALPDVGPSLAAALQAHL